MLKAVIPKLPMRDQNVTREYYINGLGFQELGDYSGYLMLRLDTIEIHFFEFKELDPLHNYGQVYIRADNIDDLYRTYIDKGVKIHPNGHLQNKLWGQKEFALLDPDNNLLTFGEAVQV